MYTMVLMMAVGGSADATAFGGRKASCHGGGYTPAYSSCSGSGYMPRPIVTFAGPIVGAQAPALAHQQGRMNGGSREGVHRHCFFFFQRRSPRTPASLAPR